MGKDLDSSTFLPEHSLLGNFCRPAWIPDFWPMGVRQ